MAEKRKRVESPTPAPLPPPPPTTAKKVAFNTLAKVIASTYGPDSTDCCFQCIDKSTKTIKNIKCHRKLLSALSPVFATMFNDTWRKDSTPILIEDTSAEAFEVFLAYFYQGTIEFTQRNVIGVLHLAHKYDIGELVTSCSTYAIEQLRTENVVHLYRFATRYDSTDLKQKCLQFLINNPAGVFKSSAFLQCGKRTLKEILKIPILACKEHTIFDACIEWAKAKCQQKKIDESRPENLRAALNDCFELIRFTDMGREEFAERYESFKTMFTREEADAYVMHFVRRGADAANDRFIHYCRSNIT